MVCAPASPVTEPRWCKLGTYILGRVAPLTMQHRHLNHQQFTLAAIDDLIARGRMADWADLRRAGLEDRALLDKVKRVCAAHISDPYAQRYHFWMHYAEKHLA